METQPLSNDAKESRRGVAMSPRNALLLAALLTFGALVGATRYVPRMLLSHIVALDGQRLALRYVDELAGAFDLPGTPVPLGDFETLQTDLLLGEEELAAATFDLFDTAKFTSAATSQAVSGYVVLNRFGDRMFSSGDPVHRSIDDPIAKRRFEHAKASLSVTTYKLNRLDETSDMVISTIVPLGRTAAAGREFRGAVVIEVHRNGVEPGILAGIERSLFALVALVLTIAAVLLALLALLRVRSARAQRKASYLAQFDPLTGLHNRESFLSQLATRVAIGHDRKRNFALVLIDIRRFGWINDTFGDVVGDAVLKAFARRIDSKLHRDPDFAQCGAKAARLGADEFAAFFSCDTRAQLERVCVSLSRICEEALPVGAVRLHVDAAFGAALFPFDGETVDELQASVRYALEIAKEEPSPADRPGSLRIFDTDIAAQHHRRRRLLQDVERAIANGEMEVHYQPQVRIDRGGPRLTGFEALLRWRHLTEGPVSPAEFIPLAEQGGVIRELGAWCLREACRQAASWEGTEPEGTEPPTIAVNVSPAQFVGDMPGQNGLVTNVRDVLAETGLPAERLELEITEGLPLGEAGEILSGLERLGVRLALDDFGTGYSSLSYLSRIPVSKVKLDRAFVLRMADDAKVRAIVRAVCAMCDGMGMTVLAEGVETEAEQDLLIELGCRDVQGYLHGRPTREPAMLLPSDAREALAA